jgi:hypothetical protein
MKKVLVQKELFDQKTFDEIRKIPHQLKIPKKFISSECSIADFMLNSEKSLPLKSETNLEQKLSPMEEKLNVHLMNIKKNLKKAFHVENSITLKCNFSQNNKMILAYEKFHKDNVKQFRHLVNDFDVIRSKSKFSVLILKFLMDILSKKDLENLSSKQSYLLQNFFINRFFRGIKTSILKKIENLKEFKILTNQWNCLNTKESNKPNPTFSIIEQISYSFSVNLWFSSSNTLNKQKIFDQFFVTSFSKNYENDLRNLFRETCIKIHNMVYFLIFKIIVSRFKQTQVVYDNIEYLEDEVCQIVQVLLQSILIFNSNAKQNKLNQRKEICSKLFQKLNSFFECGKAEDFFLMSQYIKIREMREYLGRKRKSKFIRPRRNDEKLKKIYKNLLKSMMENYKKNQNLNYTGSTDHTVYDSEDNLWISENIDIQTREKLFRKDPVQNTRMLKDSLGKIKPNQLKILYEKKNKYSSGKLKNNFYEHYFRSTSESLKVPFEHFYDPLKKIYQNTGFKSFTIKYFRLLLQSKAFKSDVIKLFKTGNFLLDVLMEYSKSFEQILASVPTIFIDQQKKKSKFLWTSYELFFAAYFFKTKMMF